MKNFVISLSAALIAFQYSSCQQIPETTATAALTAPKKWTAQEALLLLPDSFFAPLRQAHPYEYGLLASYSARKNLLHQHYTTDEICLTQSLEKEVVKKTRKTEYQEFDQHTDLQVCAYTQNKDVFVVCVQVVNWCEGLCDGVEEKVLLSFTQQYQSKTQNWSSFPLNLTDESNTQYAYRLNPKGICKTAAFKDFEKGRNRQVQSQTDIARMALESEDACLVWTGKNFE